MNSFLKKIFCSFKRKYWIRFVSKRFASVDKKGKSRVTGVLSILGIGFGVMTLITVMSVMNGFQMSSISPLIELGSSHIQVSDLPSEEVFAFLEFADSEDEILSCSPVIEGQALMTAGKYMEASCLLKGVPLDILEKDSGFKKNIHMISGEFDLSSENYVVLGATLAEELLGVHPGSQVNLFAVSGSKDVSLVSNDRLLKVRGIFSSGYLDIDQNYAFISLKGAQKFMGIKDVNTFSLKVKNHENDSALIARIQEKFPSAQVRSWRTFNKSFYSALKIEKNMMLLIIFLIFIVVGVNIYNGMRRLVFERSIEISTLLALGGTKGEIKSVFVLRGFLFGIKGTVIGLVLGILLSLNIGEVFNLISKAIFYWNYYYAVIFDPASAEFVSENPMFSVYASIPAVIQVKDVILICLFGILSPLIASERAGANILKLNVQEVLHNE